MSQALNIPPPPALPAQSGPSSELVLEVLENGKSMSYRMLLETLKIGRSSDCDIVLNNTNASRLHCILQRKGDELVLLDNNTPNGTFVNGAKIKGSVIIKGGDSILVAGARIQVRRFIRKGALVAQSLARASSERVALTEKGPAEIGQMISVPKGKIPKRFLVYGIVLVLIFLMARSGKQTDVVEVDPNAAKDDPIGTYQKIINSKSDDERNKAIQKAAEKIAESNSSIILSLEADLIRKEEAKRLEGLDKYKNFGQPQLNYKEKLAHEHLFSGIREFHYRNYARAEEHFKAALIVNETLSIAQDYLMSSMNRRRLQAIEEFKIGKRHFEGKQYGFAYASFKVVTEILRKDMTDGAESEWSRIIKNAEEYKRLARLAMGDHNIYTRGSQ